MATKWNSKEAWEDMKKNQDGQSGEGKRWKGNINEGWRESKTGNVLFEVYFEGEMILMTLVEGTYFWTIITWNCMTCSNDEKFRANSLCGQNNVWSASGIYTLNCKVPSDLLGIHNYRGQVSFLSLIYGLMANCQQMADTTF